MYINLEQKDEIKVALQSDCEKYGTDIFFNRGEVVIERNTDLYIADADIVRLDITNENKEVRNIVKEKLEALGFVVLSIELRAFCHHITAEIYFVDGSNPTAKIVKD